MNFNRPTTLQLLSKNTELFEDPAWQAVLLRSQVLHQAHHAGGQPDRASSKAAPALVLPPPGAAVASTQLHPGGGSLPTPSLALEFLDNILQLDTSSSSLSSSPSSSSSLPGKGSSGSSNGAHGSGTGVGGGRGGGRGGGSALLGNGVTHQLAGPAFPSDVLHAAADAIDKSAESVPDAHAMAMQSNDLSNLGLTGILDLVEMDLGLGGGKSTAAAAADHGTSGASGAAAVSSASSSLLSSQASILAKKHTLDGRTVGPPSSPQLKTAADRFALFHVKINDAFDRAISSAIASAKSSGHPNGDVLASEALLLAPDGAEDADGPHARKRPRLSIQFNSEFSQDSAGVFNVAENAFGFTFTSAAPDQQGGADCLRLFRESNRIYSLGSLDSKVVINPLITKELLAKTKAKEEEETKERQAKITQALKLDPKGTNANKMVAKRLHLAAEAQKMSVGAGRISPLPVTVPPASTSAPRPAPSASHGRSSVTSAVTQSKYAPVTSSSSAQAQAQAPAASSSAASNLKRLVIHFLASRPYSKEELIKRIKMHYKGKVEGAEIDQILGMVGKVGTSASNFLQTNYYRDVDLSFAFYSASERKSAYDKLKTAFERLKIAEDDPVRIAAENAFKRGQDIDKAAAAKKPAPLSAPSTTTADETLNSSPSPVTNPSGGSQSSLPSPAGSAGSAGSASSAGSTASSPLFESDQEHERAKQYFSTNYERYKQLNEIVTRNHNEFSQLGDELKLHEPGSEQHTQIVATICRLFQERKEVMEKHQQDLKSLHDELKELKLRILQYNDRKKLGSAARLSNGDEAGL